MENFWDECMGKHPHFCSFAGQPAGGQCFEERNCDFTQFADPHLRSGRNGADHRRCRI